MSGNSECRHSILSVKVMGGHSGLDLALGLQTWHLKVGKIVWGQQNLSTVGNDVGTVGILNIECRVGLPIF